MSSIFRFSELASRMQPSPIRELFSVIQRPGMISFAGGLPDPDGFPVSSFADCAEVLGRDGRQVLQYGASEGYPPLREQLLAMMAVRLGFDVPAEQLLITSGSQQAVNLMARALLDPGDVVIVEAPAYPGTIHCLRNAGARFAAVPCDGDGMRVDELPGVVRRVEAATGLRPKLVYSVPDFSNPSGASMSLERRHRLVELAAELGIPVLEDDPYGRLRYAGEMLPTLKRLAGPAPHVVYASSFSKVLAPGVRVAWTVGSAELVRAMVLMRQGEDLCTSTVTQALVAEYCRRGLLERHLESILEIYSAKCRALQAALERHLSPGSATWTAPEGGFFFWLELARGSARELFDRAVAEGVAFVPGAAFYPGPDEQVGEVHRGDRFARLCFTFADAAAIDEGCRRLAKAIAAV
ncbi:MAG TPA: PLP-dependent aminotransferase family protein [Candidatus Sulfomarinibacteraceae bacterium]|nr:PLP-dependent aminotransferase family protein [Candidatus Sulfomarinibacteraceae bacterium]